MCIIHTLKIGIESMLKKYKVEPPTADIHAPDIDLSAISEDNSQVGFPNSFCSLSPKDFLKVELLLLKMSTISQPIRMQ